MTRTERAASKARIETAISEAREIVKKGVCPHCGARLRYNSAIAGWWQCGRYGVDQFRDPEYRGHPDCSFQCFTQ